MPVTEEHMNGVLSELVIVEVLASRKGWWYTIKGKDSLLKQFHMLPFFCHFQLRQNDSLTIHPMAPVF